MSKVLISMVAAVAKNGVIGHDGNLPFRLPTDLKHFKAVTMGKPVLMGRKTFESIGRALPGRLNIIVTRDTAYKAENAEIFHSLNEALDRAKEEALSNDVSEVCIIGGGEIYRQCLDIADVLHITHVDRNAEGDATFPAIDEGRWRIAQSRRVAAQENDDADMDFVVYERL